MCLLLETIRYENGQFKNLSYHQQRVNRAQQALFTAGKKIDLEASLMKLLTSGNIEYPATEIVPKTGLFKCRVVYSSHIQKVEWLPYQVPDIETLKMVFPVTIEYSYKYANREVISTLFQQRGRANDILIVKNGLITDTSFCNILFYNGSHWVTPSYPLLKGTQRQFLLEKELIQTVEIRPKDLKNFSKARLINAMVRFEDTLDVEIKNIL